MAAVAQAELNGMKLDIYVDEDAQNPMDFLEEYGIEFICWHRRYSIGSKHSIEPSKEALEDEYPLSEYVHYPVWLYDHSAVKLSLRDFRDDWDSGLLGFLVVPRDAAEDYKEDYLASFLEVYSNYLNGYVYGYILSLTDDNGEYVEDIACWGFYGDDFLNNGMAEYVPTDLLKAVDWV